MRRKVYDVLIVGAGPVGLYTASILAKEGLEVLAIDRKEKIGHDVVCTGVVGTELFESMSLPKDSILNEIRTVRFLSPSCRSILYHSGSPIAYVIDREKFDIILLNSALKNGAKVILNSEVKTVEVKKKHVEVKIEDRSSKESVRYCALTVILATGVETKFARQIGMGYPRHFVMGVHATAELRNDGSVSIITGSIVSKGGFGWLVPESENKVRVGLMTEEDASQNFSALSNRLLRGASPNAKLRPIAQDLVSNTFSDRVISIGECAGQVKTTTGGGIYYGLIASKVATETLLKAFRKGDMSAKVLASYEKGWKAKIGGEIRKGLLVRKIWSSLPDEQIEDLFEAVERDGFAEYLSNHLRFDWHVSTIWNFIRRKEMRDLIEKVVRASGILL
jgi:digeranylgeranylglycerophospholipid reductase